MYSLVCRTMLDQDLLILLSIYCGWSLPIAICSSLVIQFIPSNILYLRTCPNLMPKSSSQFLSDSDLIKACLASCIAERFLATILLHVTTSIAGSLLDSTLEKLGFFLGCYLFIYLFTLYFKLTYTVKNITVKIK